MHTRQINARLVDAPPLKLLYGARRVVICPQYTMDDTLVLTSSVDPMFSKQSASLNRTLQILDLNAVLLWVMTDCLPLPTGDTLICDSVRAISFAVRLGFQTRLPRTITQVNSARLPA